MFSKNGGTAGMPVYTVLEIQNNGSVTIFTRARTTSRLGPSTGKTLARLGFKFNVYTVKIIRAVLLFWVHRPFFIRAVPKEDLNVNGASNDYVFFFYNDGSRWLGAGLLICFQNSCVPSRPNILLCISFIWAINFWEHLKENLLPKSTGIEVNLYIVLAIFFNFK